MHACIAQKIKPSETHHPAKKTSMAAEKGAAAVALEALDEQVLRSHIVSAGGGKTNLTSLPRRSGDADADATEEPTPVTDERRRTEELGNGNNRPMFRDLVGMDSEIDKLKREVIFPLHQSKLLHHLGVKSIPRILLHGPPRCGKTTLVRALANETGYPLYEISAADLVSGASGAPEDIRELLSPTYTRAPFIVFIDEICAMTSKLESSEKDIVNRLMAGMDPYRLLKGHDAGSEGSNSLPGCVLVIGATSRPDALDPVLRRRFEREILIDVPDEHTRRTFLYALTRNLKCDVNIYCDKIARCTLGFVVEDLVALAETAGTCAANRIMEPRNDEFYRKGRRLRIEDCFMKQFSDEEMKNLGITENDFMEAAKIVRPSSRLKDLSTTPNAKWDDVVGLQSLKLVFERHVVKPIKFPEVYKDLGEDLATTFFLYGPSGCGKSLIVEALANEAGANFLHIKDPTLWRFGAQRELGMHIIFNYARDHPPCIVFFDQLERLFRGWRLADFGKLVTELIYAEESSGVYIICATNRPKDVNDLERSAFSFRPWHLYVPLPTPEERGAILKALAQNKPIDADVDLMTLGKGIACERFSGARLSYLMKEAIKAAIDRPILSGGGHSIPWTIKDVDFKNALLKISPFVSTKEMKKWEDLVGEWGESGMRW